jgi:hypothetical protein
MDNWQIDPYEIKIQEPAGDIEGADSGNEPEWPGP